MKTSENLKKERERGATIPRWIALVVALVFWIVGVPLFYGVLPWAVSFLMPRYGWSDGRPATWNLLGLFVVMIATALLIWIMILHLSQTSHVPERVALEPTPSYLLESGPYAFSRHPMYLAELTLLFGWTIFYGSLSVLTAFLIAGIYFNFVHIPREEHALEARFGETYREYKDHIPRWFGKIQQ